MRPLRSTICCSGQNAGTTEEERRYEYVKLNLCMRVRICSDCCGTDRTSIHSLKTKVDLGKTPMYIVKITVLWTRCTDDRYNHKHNLGRGEGLDGLSSSNIKIGPTKNVYFN